MGCTQQGWNSFSFGAWDYFFQLFQEKGVYQFIIQHESPSQGPTSIQVLPKRQLFE